MLPFSDPRVRKKTAKTEELTQERGNESGAHAGRVNLVSLHRVRQGKTRTRLKAHAEKKGHRSAERPHRLTEVAAPSAPLEQFAGTKSTAKGFDNSEQEEHVRPPRRGQENPG